MMLRRRSLSRAAVVVAILAALAGCAPAAPSGGEAPSGTGGEGEGEPTTLDCSKVTDEYYEVFVDPRLTVEPSLEVYPLEEGDAISFADTGSEDPNTTYSFEDYYIDDEGSVFPNGGEIFVGAEATGTFEITGPQAPEGIDGGPYAGFVEIRATTGAGSTLLARLCVAYAASK